jgi:hypothetical protein
MYKLKLKEGLVCVVRKRGGSEKTIVGGHFYTQDQLKDLYDNGHKNLVSYTKQKKDEETIDTTTDTI